MASGSISPAQAEQDAAVEEDLRAALAASRGHFRYESGHHGDLWLDLDRMLVDARRSRRWAAALAHRAAGCRPEFVCGPLTGGALLAQSIAAEMGTGFCFAERLAAGENAVRYSIPHTLRPGLQGKRVLLVDDAVNAGSALVGTLADLVDCGAVPAGIACLLALGPVAAQIADEEEVPLFVLASLERGLWAAEACPLCAAHVPLTNQANG